MSYSPSVEMPTRPLMDSGTFPPASWIKASPCLTRPSAKQQKRSACSSTPLAYATSTPHMSTAPAPSPGSACSSTPNAGSANPQIVNPENAQPSVGSPSTHYQTSSLTTPPKASTPTAT